MRRKSTIVRIVNAVAPTTSRLAPGWSAIWLNRLFTAPIRHSAPERETAWLADAEVSRLSFKGGRELALYTWGRPTDPLIVLAHGWAGRGGQLGALAAPLVEQGFRVVTFDQPAHGASDGVRTALPEFAESVERIAEVMGPIYGLIGHSLGTAGANVAMSRGLHIKRLVYLSPPEALPDYLTRAAQYLGFTVEVADRGRMRLERRYGVPFEAARGVPLARAMSADLLVIHDTGDVEVPYAEGAALAEAWPGARIMSTEGLGHRRIVRDPDVVRAAVDFMAEGATGQRRWSDGYTPHTSAAGR